MKVKIIKVISKIPHIKVWCKTDLGNLSLIWKDDNPIENQEYEVELENDEILMLNNNVYITEELPTIFEDEQGITIIGDLESIDEDGYLVMRVENSIISFLAQNINLNVGLRIMIQITFLEAYPVSY